MPPEWAGQTIGRYARLDYLWNDAPVFKHEFLDYYLFLNDFGVFAVNENMADDSYYLLVADIGGYYGFQTWNGAVQEWQFDNSWSLDFRN